MKREDVKREDVKRGKRQSIFSRFHVFTFHVVVLTFHALTAPALAQPTQEEVLKSIGDNVGQPVDSTRFVASLAGIAGVILLLVVAGQWRSRERRPRALNHHGRLLKEVLRHVPLKGAELRQIKALAPQARGANGHGERVSSPLTLLLCPSLLADAAKQSRGKADLPVVAALVKKLLARR